MQFGSQVFSPGSLVRNDNLAVQYEDVHGVVQPKKKGKKESRQHLPKVHSSTYCTALVV